MSANDFAEWHLRIRVSAAQTVLLLATLLATVQATAQPETQTEPDLIRQDIRAQLDTLPEDDPAASTFRLALEAIDRAVSLSERAEEFRKLTAESEIQTAQIRGMLSAPPAPIVLDATSDATLSEIRSLESEAASALEAARTQSSDLASEASRRDARIRDIPRLLDLARQRRAMLRAEVGATEAADSTANRSDAQAALARAQLAEVSAEIALLEAEAASYEARRDLLPARRDLAARRITELEQQLTAWQQLARETAARAAQLAAEEARELQRRAATQDAVIQQYAEENADLTAQLDPEGEVRAGTRSARDRAASVQDRIDEILRNYESIRARLAAADLNQATGRLLRSQFEELDDIGALRASMAATRRQFEAAEYTLIERREARDALRSIDRETARLISEVSSGAESDALADVARELATARRDLLSELVNDASRQVEAVFALKRAEQRLLDVAVAYRSFIRERILWVRSLPADRGPTLADIRETVAWSTDPGAWSQTRSALASWAAENPTRASAPMVLLVAAVLAAIAARGRQKRIAEKIRRPATDSIWLTVPALLWTVVRALPVPVGLYLVGWCLRRPESQSELGLALGLAFAGAAVVWFGFAFLRSLTQPGGVAHLHFRWPVAAAARVRKDSLWAGIALSLSMATMAFTDSSGLEGATATLGRLGFSFGAIAVSAFVFRVLHPRGPVVGAYVASGQGEWANRFRLLWFWPQVAFPVVFVGMAWLGYVYTAYQLSWLLALTFFLIVVVAIGNMFLRRWLFVTRRRLALDQARRKREEAARQAETAGSEPAVTENGAAAEEERIDLAELSSQARQLIRVASAAAIAVGLISIWGDFLPALRQLERVELYPSIRIAEVESSPDDGVLSPMAALAAETRATPTGASPTGAPGADSADGSAIASPMPGQLPMAGEAGAATGPEENGGIAVITLADLGRSLLFLLGTIIAFRNLPGLVEIVLLQRLPLDAGSRYAIDTVLKYTIAILGSFATLSAIGISWSSVQWLAAALTFGLAFGLQEIFANFISGLIILAERPIRIGDTVTVQNVSGVVSRIRMRATTITDWERKELVIPNKAFITGDVVNWTLSDPVLRLSVPVGVSYGTDIDEAERLLIAAAEAQENVLSDPAPFVIFAAFGESTLDLELRAFVPHIDYLVSTRTALHKRVIKVFREAGIEIAFPQRDLNVRSVEGLGVIAVRNEHNPDTHTDER